MRERARFCDGALSHEHPRRPLRLVRGWKKKHLGNANRSRGAFLPTEERGWMVLAFDAFGACFEWAFYAIAAMQDGVARSVETCTEAYTVPISQELR